jgi:glucose/arabinose dehydrogenase
MAVPAWAGAQGNGRTPCDPDNAGLKLPPGFCASIFADTVQGARHLWVAPNGDVFVSRQGGTNGGITALRDTNSDGKADERVKFATGFNSSEVAMFGGYLYTENITGVLRFPYKAGSASAPPKQSSKDCQTAATSTRRSRSIATDRFTSTSARRRTPVRRRIESRIHRARSRAPI